MTPMSVTCPSCQATLRTPPGFAGTRVKCKRCGGSFALGPPPPPAAAPLDLPDAAPLDLPDADELFTQQTIAPGGPPSRPPLGGGFDPFAEQTFVPGAAPRPPLGGGFDPFAQQTFAPGPAPASSPLDPFAPDPFAHQTFAPDPFALQTFAPAAGPAGPPAWGNAPAAPPPAGPYPPPYDWSAQTPPAWDDPADPLPVAAALPPDPGRPPPLPPRPPGPSKIRVWPLVVSIVSLAVTAGSLAGIYAIRKPAGDQKAQAGSGSLGRHACIAIESGGVRLLVADFQKTDAGVDFEFPQEPVNRSVSLAPGKGAKGLAPDKVDEAMKAVELYVKRCREQLDVPTGNLVVACNSGVVSEFQTDPAALRAVQQGLTARVREAGGGELQHITADDEARYGALGCVPAAERFDAVLLDIGGGSTKCGYHNKTEPFTGFRLPFATRGFEDAAAAAAKQQGRPFPAAAEGLRAEKLNAPLAQAKKDRPPLANRKNYHLLGGAAWAATVATHPAEFKNTRITLTPDDLRRFDDLVSAPGQTMAGIEKAVLNPVPAGPDRDRAAEQWAGVSGAFTVTRLVAAAKILRACSEEFEFQGKKVQFFTHSLYAWLLGYTLAKTGFER